MISSGRAYFCSFQLKYILVIGLAIKVVLSVSNVDSKNLQLSASDVKNSSLKLEYNLNQTTKLVNVSLNNININPSDNDKISNGSFVVSKLRKDELLPISTNSIDVTSAKNYEDNRIYVEDQDHVVNPLARRSNIPMQIPFRTYPFRPPILLKVRRRPNPLKMDRSQFKNALLGLQNPQLYGGDIVLLSRSGKKSDKTLIKYARAALVSNTSLWPLGKIYFELDESVRHIEDLIFKVMNQFHSKTCIRFEPKLGDEPDYIRIEAVRGCFSYVGRIGGEQTLSLEGIGCEFPGTIAHELMHAVGFYHQQNRSDRDDHLEILWDNIARSKHNQFQKMAPWDNKLLNEFDYDSIMLYGPRTFGKTLDTITMKAKRDGVVLREIIEKRGLSLKDISSINKLYGCVGSEYAI